MSYQEVLETEVEVRSGGRALQKSATSAKAESFSQNKITNCALRCRKLE